MTINFDQGDTTVGLAGDWHGNLTWALKTLDMLKGEGITTVYHLGDFGIWPGPKGDVFLTMVNTKCHDYGITLAITPGNHEDWNRLDTLFASGSRDEPKQLASNIWVLPRSHRWTHCGRSFVSLGGAPSIDFGYRILNKSWWPTETITREDVDRTIAGGYADIMLTHDAPAGGVDAVERIVNSPSMWSAEALRYTAIGRRLLTEAWAGVQPSLLAHGHFHVPGIRNLDDGRRIISLDMDDTRFNLAKLVLDTDGPVGFEWIGQQEAR